MDLEFLLQSVLLATSKIFGLGQDISDQDITQLVRRNFQEGSRVTLPQLLVWASKTEEIVSFFAKFQLDGPQNISQKVLQESEFVVFNKHAGDGLNYDFPPSSGQGDVKQAFVAKTAAQLVQNKRSQNFRAWLHTALQPLISYRLESVTMNNYLKVPDEVKVRLEWVYGIRCQDTKRALQYTVGKQYAESVGTRNKYEKKMMDYNEEVIYFVSSYVVLVNVQLNRQRFYTQHLQEIISLAISNLNGDFVATGEYSESTKPAIHIWNSRTLDNISVLQGIHQQGVHLLAFSSDDRFLVTCGLQNPSAVLIYDWAAGLVIVSTSIHSPTQDIQVLHGHAAPIQNQGAEVDAQIQEKFSQEVIDGFVIMSLESLIVFVFDSKRNEFKTSYISFEQASSHTVATPLCSLSILTDYKNAFFKQGNAGDVVRNEDENDAAVLDYNHTLKHLVLTGHKDGKVLIWRLQQFIGVLDDYQCEVTAMTRCFEGIAFATIKGHIYIWDEYLLKCGKIVDINQMPFKILSTYIVNLDFNQRRLLVLTMHGDAIEIILSEAGSTKTIKAQRLNTIVRITGRQNKALTVLNQTEQTIMVGGDNGVVTSYDIATHELIDIWNVGEAVVSLATLTLEEGGFVVAAGTESGKVVIRQDWEEFIPRQHECGQKSIIDVKFSKNGQLIAAASLDKNIYLLKYNEGEYQALAACKLENGFPVALNFSEDSQRIVISTNQRKLLVLDPTNFMLMYKPEDLSSCFWSSWLSKFPLITKSANSQMMPIALGNLSNIVAAGDENGNVYVWRDVESIKENIGNNFVTHTANVQKVEFTLDDKRLLSLGQNDQSMCQYKIKPIYYKESQINLKRGVNEISQNFGIQKIVLHPVEDETLILELNYCFQIQSRKTDNIQDQTALVRGSNNSTVNRIHAKVSQSDQSWKRPPSISLILEHIYGVLTSDKRHTIMYMHFFSKLDQDLLERAKHKQESGAGVASQILSLGVQAEKKLDFILPRILGSDYQTLLKQQQPIQYDPIHATCNKHLVYYISRFGVVYESGKRRQSFYQGHKLKISAIAKHPYLRIVATGEVNVNPQIHVWDAQTMETMKILDTAHSGGVLHLIFSTDGQKLISIGMDRTFSIQIFNWEQKRSLAFRNSGYFPIFGVRFNPYDDSKFITCGYQHLAEWQLNGSHLSCVKFTNVYGVPGGGAPREMLDEQNLDDPRNKQKCILLCMDFISYRLGHSVQSDIVFGNNLGDISTYCSSKYFVLHEQAHPGAAINCIRVTNSLSMDLKTVCVITAGEDGMVKIWDASIQLRQQVDLKQSVAVHDLKNIKAYGVQSLDVFPCDRQNQHSTATVKVLVGMRSGDITEILFDFNRQHVSVEDIQNSKNLTQEQKNQQIQKAKYAEGMNNRYIVKFQPIFDCHSSLQISFKQKKIITCLYPLFGILASVGNDETLMLWDINKNECIVTKNLGTQATCLDFSPDGKFLAIGLVNGVFLLLESHVERLNFGTYLEEFSLPTLAVIMCPKESKSSIINIKFSYKGDFLVVSYNNEYHLQDLLDDAEQADNPVSSMTGNVGKKPEPGAQKQVRRDPSFVLIYVNKMSDKNPGMHLNSKDPYVKMQKVQIPLQEYQSNAVVRSKLAITKMDFSDDDRFIQMCSQLIDKDNNITLGSNEDIFVVWDIAQNCFISNYDMFRHAQWPDWSMSSTINARYVNQTFDRGIDDEEKKKYLLECCTMTNVARFNLLDNAIMGSNFGEIFAFRFPAVYLDKSNIMEFRHDKVPKREMALSKGFDALTSMIQSINIFEDRKVFVTGNNDQCILQYRVEYEDQDWELDFNNFLADMPDPFGEVPHYSKFVSLINEIWHQRLELAEVQQNTDQEEFKDPTCELELEHVIGRRAYDRRNNVKIDCNERIIYSASSLIVFLQDNQDPDAESFVHQTFMRPQDEKFTSTFPEVSCFTLSEDRRLLFVCTNHVEASLIVWEISTNLQLYKINLPQLSIITCVKVAYDNNHCAIVGVTPEYVASLVLLEIESNTIIVQKLFLHSLPYKIKDVAFIPGYTRRLVSCGIQHMNFWKFNGQSFEYTVGELTIPKAFSSVGAGVYSHNKENQGKFGLNLVCQDSEMINTVLKNQKNSKANKVNALDEELENIFVSFLCCGFINDTLITAGDDGYLYLWENERIVRRIFAHEGAIFALDCNEKLGFLASGGIEGVVTLWRILVEPRSNIKSLDKLKVYNLRKNLHAQQAVMNPEYNVQSLCLGYNKIVVGMRSGTILEMPISEDSTKMVRPNVDKSSKIRKWMQCIDHEIPISVAVDMVSQRVFTMTSAGLFTVWDLLTFDVIYSKDFHKVALDIIAFKLQNKVLMVFENDIHVLDANVSGGYDELKEYELKLNKISDVKLNSNERLLGVASTSSLTPEVSLYETEDGFAKLSTFYGFKASIRYIDFSTDNYYLQCEDNLGEVQLFEIESSRIINTDAIDFDLEWLGEGLRSYSPLENVRAQYSSDNKIMQITKLSGKPIVAIGDELGTIRLFNYPNNGSDGYFQCYAEHLHSITKCLFTHDQRFFVSMSSSDRCVFKWRCKYNEKKIRDLMSLLVK